MCRNGVCEAGSGESCVSCPTDCNGVQGGKGTVFYVSKSTDGGATWAQIKGNGVELSLVKQIVEVHGGPAAAAEAGRLAAEAAAGSR